MRSFLVSAPAPALAATLAFCLALAGPAAQAQTYKWTDSAGRIVISDSPPPGSARDVSKTGQAAESEGPSFAVRKAMENFPVTLYTAADCVAECNDARKLLNGRGIPFTEKMVKTNEEIAALKQLAGQALVPTVSIGKQTITGFDKTAYDNLLDLAGYPKTAPYGAKPAGGLTP